MVCVMLVLLFYYRLQSRELRLIRRVVLFSHYILVLTCGQLQYRVLDDGLGHAGWVCGVACCYAALRSVVLAGLASSKMFHHCAIL